ncbi:uncharacterized protein LY89DRAFT_448160 [Mollisia scopiformis]|uniref:Secreted protein n=1 Tax=Mollisia scopiformis TaxID=149040 RepID=A0A194XLF5_MOLSC|nr:uncharacterized protein LY89DRAFT_448160 [Mollisia scopiformis]KUJ20607.1 hypothetical protein LY89DRAFT_448160 [Mollisia scopiformis]
MNALPCMVVLFRYRSSLSLCAAAGSYLARSSLGSTDTARFGQKTLRGPEELEKRRKFRRCFCHFVVDQTLHLDPLQLLHSTHGRGNTIRMRVCSGVEVRFFPGCHARWLFASHLFRPRVQAGMKHIKQVRWVKVDNFRGGSIWPVLAFGNSLACKACLVLFCQNASRGLTDTRAKLALQLRNTRTDFPLKWQVEVAEVP